MAYLILWRRTKSHRIEIYDLYRGGFKPLDQILNEVSPFVPEMYQRLKEVNFKINKVVHASEIFPSEIGRACAYDGIPQVVIFIGGCDRATFQSYATKLQQLGVVKC